MNRRRRRAANGRWWNWSIVHRQATGQLDWASQSVQIAVSAKGQASQLGQSDIHLNETMNMDRQQTGEHHTQTHPDKANYNWEVNREREKAESKKKVNASPHRTVGVHHFVQELVK